jgi:hypothetical protein
MEYQISYIEFWKKKDRGGFTTIEEAIRWIEDYCIKAKTSAQNFKIQVILSRQEYTQLLNQTELKTFRLKKPTVVSEDIEDPEDGVFCNSSYEEEEK